MGRKAFGFFFTRYVIKTALFDWDFLSMGTLAMSCGDIRTVILAGIFRGYDFHGCVRDAAALFFHFAQRTMVGNYLKLIILSKG